MLIRTRALTVRLSGNLPAGSQVRQAFGPVSGAIRPLFSMLSTESVRDTQSMPTCVYEVRRGSQTGDIVRYANIGEPVYHEWECKSGT